MSNWTDSHNTIIQALRSSDELNRFSVRELVDATDLSAATIRENLNFIEANKTKIGRTWHYWLPIDSVHRKNETFKGYWYKVKNTLRGLGYSIKNAPMQVQVELQQQCFDGYMGLDSGKNPLRCIPKHPTQVALEVKRWIEATPDVDDHEREEMSVGERPELVESVT